MFLELLLDENIELYSTDDDTMQATWGMRLR